MSTEVLKYLDVSRFTILKARVVCDDYDACEHGYKYERESKIFRQMLTTLNIRRFEFYGREMSFLINNLVCSGTNSLFTSIPSLSITTILVKSDVLCNLVIRCPHLRFLAIEADKLVDIVRVARAAINSCKARLEIYIEYGYESVHIRNGHHFIFNSCADKLRGCSGGNMNYFQWKYFLLDYGMPPVLMHPYDPYGDIVLDSPCVCRLDVPRLRGIRDNEWKILVRQLVV